VTEAGYPRERVERLLTDTRLADAYRIIPRRYLDTPLGAAPGDSRFCTKADGFTVLYVSPAFATAFIETVVRDRFTRAPIREVPLKEITGRAWARITTRSRARLNLLDLRKDGCVRLGAPTDAVHARNHAAGRTVGRVIYTQHEEIDGVLFASCLTGADVCAVFDRAIAKLHVTGTGMLQNHPQLPEILERHQIHLVVWQ
jgi:hypothetical protein